MGQPFEAEDLFLHRRITSVHCVPARNEAACAVQSVDRDRDQYLSAIWRVPLGDGDPVQLTSGTSLDDNPRWSPDGRRLAFLSDRSGGTPQVFLIDVEGGEARQLSHFRKGADSIAWSPDGRHLLATCQVQVDPD